MAAADSGPQQLRGIDFDVAGLRLTQRNRAGMNQGPRTLSYNPAENMVLITYEAETGGTYELYSVPKDTSRSVDSAVRCCAGCSSPIFQESIFESLKTSKGGSRS